ncbi:MAG TPA: NAD(P)/FAD-dependent oxidoreductase [Polyangia bacterium]|jgi:cation diffusion facilitator CzcD-associated flavoprotein CzcO|nr:NAD(P)/FAD-dependent oxidoreductase [Polyangia bacterium]
MTLESLAEQVRQDLDVLGYPRRDWLAPRHTRQAPDVGAPILDVLIVGAGQGGLATAFALQRERVTNILVVDENPLDRAGPWLNFARMRTLRTPKHLTGPDLGIPSLTPRSWYEAQHGDGSWQALGLYPKEAWAAYLAWYRQTLDIPVRPDTRVGALRWNAAENVWEAPCGPGDQTLYARRVVLATGIAGSGSWEVPALIRDALPARLYAHTHDDIDFAALAGKRIAVLGAGASAFDNAATALEHGARELHLCFRRPALVNVNPYRWAEFVGFLKHLGDLPDADKWRFIRQILRMGQLPPADTYERARRHPGFHLHASCAWQSLELRGDTIQITNARGEGHEVDFVIVGTGFVTDLGRRPELRAIERQIARWADRYQPPEGEQHADLSRHPYLGPAFEFTERRPGEAPYLRTLYNYTFGGLLSLGFGGASISGMKYSVPRLVAGITGSLFVEDRDAHYDSLRRFAEAEF